MTREIHDTANSAQFRFMPPGTIGSAGSRL
jgi:hypothetical protein